MDSPSVGNLPGGPGPIPFSASWPDQVLEGTLAINPCVGNAHLVTLDLYLHGRRLGSASLTEESALDLALRLVGTIMDRRRAAEAASTLPLSASVPYCSLSSEGSPAVAESSNKIDQGLRSGLQPNWCSHSSIRSK